MAPGVIPGVAPPHSPCRTSGKNVGVAPVFSLSAGAVRDRRRRTNNPNSDGDIWKGGMWHPPQLFLWHPPCCRCHMSLGPGLGPGFDPGTGQRSGQTRLGHAAASGLINRIVLHVR